MSTDVYVLQRDIEQPNDHCLKAGVEFKKHGNTPDSAYVSECGRRSFHPSIVENKLSIWFKKKEQPVMAQYPNEIKGQKLSNFEIEIASVINRFSRENMSDTPDFILATYLNNCLNAYEKATQQKKNWFK